MSGFYDHATERKPEPHQIYAASRPRKGDPITYRGVVTGEVSSVEGSICWTEYSDGSGTEPFIWAFKDGLNNLHDWPTKEKDND